MSLKATIDLPERNPPETVDFDSLESGTIYQAVYNGMNSCTTFVIVLDTGVIRIDSDGDIMAYESGYDLQNAIDDCDAFIARHDLQLDIKLVSSNRKVR